jgi:hypothetical protein
VYRSFLIRCIYHYIRSTDAKRTTFLQNDGSEAKDLSVIKPASNKQNILLIKESYCNVLVGGSLFTMELYCTPKVSTLQLNTVGNSSNTRTRPTCMVPEHTPIKFFQQDLLWQSSNTRSHSCSQKASKYTSAQSIVGLSVLFHTTTALRRIFHR